MVGGENGFPKIKTTKLVKGQGLARLMIEENLETLWISLTMELSDIKNDELFVAVGNIFKSYSW